MERFREYDDLAVALAELRPEPRPDFAAELDALVAADFRPRSRQGRSPFAALATRLRGLSPQRLLFATGGTALAAITIATVVVASVDSGPGPVAFEQHVATERRGAKPPAQPFSEEIPRASDRSTSAGSAVRDQAGSEGVGSPGVQYLSPAPRSDTNGELQSASPSQLSGSNAAYTPLSRTRNRDVERSAEIGLLAEPADVAEDSAKVFDAVHDARGIVLHSTTTTGKNPGAHFDLLIPSAKLGDALAAFSAIDEVGTRHEATDDITAATATAGERLRDSRARVDSLLAQLSAAETDSEREAAEIALRGERRQAARLRAQLDRLHQRTDFSRVSLRIETSASETGPAGNWGVDDAIDDAGHILGIAAGVTLIALAVLAPLAFIGLLAWLGHRAWLRRARNRALA